LRWIPRGEEGEEERKEEEEMQLSFRRKIKYTKGLELIEILN
jgi:hypothetical protein